MARSVDGLADRLKRTRVRHDPILWVRRPFAARVDLADQCHTNRTGVPVPPKGDGTTQIIAAQMGGYLMESDDSVGPLSRTARDQSFDR